MIQVCACGKRTLVCATDSQRLVLEFVEGKRHDWSTWEVEDGQPRRWRGPDSSEIYTRGVFVNHAPRCTAGQGRLAP